MTLLDVLMFLVFLTFCAIFWDWLKVALLALIPLALAGIAAVAIIPMFIWFLGRVLHPFIEWLATLMY